MRKIVYLIAVVFALGAVSCTKQDIRPNAKVSTSEPVYRASGGDGDENGEVEGNGGITDPNKEITEEEDANSNNAN